MSGNLIFVQWTNNFGGLEKLTQTIQEKITDYNLNVLVLMHNKNGIKYKRELFLDSERPITKLYYSYFKKVKSHSNDIFHLNNTGSKILFASYIGGARKIVYHFHGTKFSSGFFDKLVWKILEDKVEVIANSTYLKTLIEQKLNLKNIHLIPNIIDTKKFNYTNKNLSSNFTITFAGRFTKGKNINIILEVAKILSKTHQEIKFQLYGDGPEKNNLEKTIKELNLTPFVKLNNFVDNITEVYKNADLFLFLSGYESFGNVVAEAILSGTPVLCYKIPALLDIVKQDYFFTDTLNPEEIAERILEIKNNYNFALEELKKNYKFLSDYLDNEKIINKFKQIYNKLQN